MHPAPAAKILFTRTHFKHTEALQGSIGWIVVQNATKPSSGKGYGRDSLDMPSRQVLLAQHT